MSKTKKVEKNTVANTELLEKQTSTNTNQLVDIENFIQKNRTLLYVAVGVVVLAVVAYLGYYYLSTSQEQEAQEELFPAVYFLESDSIKRALKGDGNYTGLESVSEDYTLSKASGLANFYKGVAYMKDGKFKQAIESLEKFNANDLLVQARAYCLIGDANMELNKLNEAVNYYRKASNYKPNEQFTPTYLMKLALALEMQKKYSEAIVVYDEVINKYFKSQELNNAKKMKARLEALAQK